MEKIGIIIYIFTGVLVGYFLYQYSEFSLYIGGIAMSFLFLNMAVLYLYKGFKDKEMAVIKFMGINFTKDILWAIFWMYILKKNEVLIIFLAVIFMLLSVPIYLSVLKDLKNNQKSDKNQL